MIDYFRRHHHLLFRIGVMMKAADGALEVVLGSIFYFVSYGTISRMALRIVAEELGEVPQDPFWHFIFGRFHGFTPHVQFVWGVILLGHGIAKLIIVIGLLRDEDWAYPVSIAVFGLFIAYQLFELSHGHSIFLELITMVDVGVIGLVWYEYTHRPFARK